MKKIRRQSNPSLAIVIGVVSQGIRIRFGRSLVTIVGVICGIAFLMAVLTGMALKKGVQREDELRSETRRMLSFLTAEIGPLEGKTLSLVAQGGLSEAETRLVEAMQAEGAAEVRAWRGGAATGPSLPETRGVAKEDELGREASAVVLLGSGPPPALDWQEVFAQSRQRALSWTRQPPIEVEQAAAELGITTVPLNREYKPEELAAMAEEARKARFRAIWVAVISVFVTVIGIANAMLMSVTERFREIGTMKCLGALSSFVRRLFLMESAFIGLVGGLVGCLTGIAFSTTLYSFTYGFAMVLSAAAENAGLLVQYAFGSFLAGIVLSIVAAIYPATVASRMVPASALRSNV